MHVHVHEFDVLLTDLDQSITEDLETAEPDTLVAHVAVLAQLALRAPDAFEQRSDVIIGYLVKYVLRSEKEEDAVSPIFDTSIHS